MSDVFARPLVLTDDGARHEPMALGRLLAPDILPIDPAKDNLLGRTDDGLLFKPAEMLSELEQVLSVIDGKLRASVDIQFDATTNELKLLGAGSAVLATVKLPVVPGLPTVAELLKDFTPPPLEFGTQPTGTYMHLQFQTSDGTVKDIYYNVSDLVDVYEGGDGITVTGKTIALKVVPNRGLAAGPEGAYVKPDKLVHPDEKLLAVTNGQFYTSLGIRVDAAANSVQLLGLGGQTIAEASLPPYSGAPQTVEVVSGITPPGLPRGTYLHMVFQRADGTAEDLYYDLSPVVDDYEGGDGIDITDNVVSVKPEAGKGISVTPNGTAVALTELIHEKEKVIGASDNKLYTQLKLEVKNDKLLLLGKDAQELSRVDLPKPQELTASNGIDIADDKVSVRVGSSGILVFTTEKELDVNPPSLVSVSPNNALQKSAIDGKLYVKKGLDASTLGTGLVLDATTSKVSVSLSDLVSTGNGLIVDAGGKLNIDLDILAKKLSEKIAVGVSADSGNLLTAGTDKKPYLPADLGTL